jgi:two-component system sensor histidine kinase YesM
MITVSAERLLSDTGTPIIRIIVEDDGKGIPAEHLSVINGLLKEGKSDGNTGYGIFNVNERIKLYYGAEYGLFLESVEDRYTRAILTIPEVKAGA